MRFFAESGDRFSTNSRAIRFRIVDQGLWELSSNRIQAEQAEFFGKADADCTSACEVL
jgi:hypothetical protein